MKSWLCLIHIQHCVFVPPAGRSGGFCIAWKSGLDLEPVFVSRNAINCLIYSDPPSNPWSFYAIYGPPTASQCHEFWNTLPNTLSRLPTSRLLTGDLNGTLSNFKFWNNNIRIGGFSSSSSALRGCFNTLRLVDLGSYGLQFTWNQIRGGSMFYKAHVNRAIASSDWCLSFPNAFVKTISNCASDHLPLVLDTIGDSCNSYKPFKFKAIWCKDI